MDGPKSVETMEWFKGLVENGVLDPASGGDVSLIGINSGMGVSLSPLISNAAVSNSDSESFCYLADQRTSAHLM